MPVLPPIFTSYPELTSFTASNTSLKEISASSLVNSKNLQSLMFRTGLITILKNRTFKECESLKNLQITSHKISMIETEAFFGLNNLTSLYFIDNKLTSIHPDVFGTLPKLNNIVLSKNQLTTLDAKTFSKNPELISVGLESNQISELPANLLQYQKPLSSFYVTNNQLKSMQTYGAIYFEGSLNQLTILNITPFTEYVMVSDNRLNKLNCANKTLSVKSLYARKNSLTNFACIRDMTNLTSLDLNINSLSKITQKAFLKLTKLKYMTIYNQTKLQTLVPKAFAPLKNLTNLQVDRLRNYKNLRQILPSLNFLYLTTATWNCNHTKNVSDTLFSQKIRMSYNYYLDRYQCNITQPLFK